MATNKGVCHVCEKKKINVPVSIKPEWGHNKGVMCLCEKLICEKCIKMKKCSCGKLDVVACEDCVNFSAYCENCGLAVCHICKEMFYTSGNRCKKCELFACKLHMSEIKSDDNDEVIPYYNRMCDECRLGKCNDCSKILYFGNTYICWECDVGKDHCFACNKKTITKACSKCLTKFCFECSMHHHGCKKD